MSTKCTCRRVFPRLSCRVTTFKFVVRVRYARYDLYIVIDALAPSEGTPTGSRLAST